MNRARLAIFVALTAFSALFLVWSFTPLADARLDEDEGIDPDRPAGIQAPLDESEYIRQREAFVALLHGVDPTKPFDPEARVRANAMMDVQVAALTRRVQESLSTDTPLALPNWVELGPSPIPLGQTATTRVAVSGRISAIEIDPTDPNKVYVGAAQGGVYRSLDGGTTWTPIFDTAQTLAIGTLNLDPANGWLWVGTGEANGSGDCYAGVGLYRIENVNTTATLVGPINPIRNYNDQLGNPRSAGFFTGRAISKILRVPGDPNTLFVGVAGGVIGLGGNPPFGGFIPPSAIRGLVRLANVSGPAAGITGTRLAVSTVDTGQGLCFDNPCTVNRSVNDMVLDPQDPSGNKLIVWLNGLNVAGDGGIYRSTNAMAGSPTFTQTLVTTSTTVANGRGELRTYARAGVTEIYVASGEPSNVPAGATICNSATSFGALRRSDDGGAIWSAKLQGGGGFCAGQCFYNIGFDLVPGTATSTDKLLLGGNVASGTCSRQQATSLDGGATTFTSHAATTHADTHVIKIAPSNPNIVYRGDDGGVWKSTDGGNTWLTQNNSTLRATQFQSIAVHPTDPNISIGGTQDNGSNMLLTGGTTWLHSDDGDGGFAMIDQSAPLTMYHTYFNQAGTQIGYSRSLTGGTFGSWSFLGCSGTGTTNGITCTNAVNFYCPTALGPGSPNTVYIATDRLYRSSTQGTANAIVSQAPLVSGVPVSAVGISQLDDNYRIVGNNNGALWFTTTGSSTLTSLDPVGAGSAIPDFYVARLVFDPTNKNIAYISLGNYSGGIAPAQSHVWKATNLNTAPVLTSINGSGINILPDVPVNSFAVDGNDPSHPGISVLYAGTDIGVYQSTDGGVTWLPFGQGLPRVAVFDMAIQNVKRVLRIATHGRGMWEAALPTGGTPTPTPTPIPSPTPTPTLTPTPTPIPEISISGTVSYCSNPASGPVPNVTLTLTGTTSGSTLSDGSGNYSFPGLTSGGNYTVTPTKTALTPGSAGISTTDVLGVQRHFLGITPIPAGCRLTAADVNGDSGVTTVDVIAVQRFFLGFTNGIANVGKYNFNPASRSYPGASGNQTGQNYDTLVFGDVASGFVHRSDGPFHDAAASSETNEIPPTVAAVTLPEITVDRAMTEFSAAVKVSAIDGKNKLVGFQGDLLFDERVVAFQRQPTGKAELTRDNWNVSGNVLPGPGPIRTLRISAYSEDFKPLSGSGTLFELKMTRTAGGDRSTPLIWAAPPDHFIFIDADLNTQRPASSPAGRSFTPRSPAR